MALTLQLVAGATVVVATLLQPGPLDGWDYVAAPAFGVLSLLALRELIKGEPSGGGDRVQ